MSTSNDPQPSPMPEPDPAMRAAVPTPNQLTSPGRSARGRQRRVRLPVILFLATCLSTFWVGANIWAPADAVLNAAHHDSLLPIRRTLMAHWREGLTYMCCVLAILLTHEMGHFLATLRYRIPASLPYFIPFPISPIGTMGAVIGMDGMRADRKEMFDIGLAGPIAGLIVAIPVMWLGVQRLDLSQPEWGPYAVDPPLAVKLALDYVQPPGYVPGKAIWFSQFNPFFIAGWVGLLITGLNMLPVSQLDGGHVIYTLFGRRAHWIARGFVFLAVVYIGYSLFFHGQWNWIVMLVLVLLIGTDHPPTRDDTVPLGVVRYTVGCAATLIPVFCFAPRLIVFGSG